MVPAYLQRRPDALVGVRGRHPDVGEDRVGSELLDGGKELGQVGDGRDQLQVVGRREERGRSFADQVVVLGEHDPKRHGRMLSPEGPPA